MKLIDLFFPKTTPRQRLKEIRIFLDTDLKDYEKSSDLTVRVYEDQSNFDSDRFVYVLVKNRKTDSIDFKRKLCPFERFSDILKVITSDYSPFLIIGYQGQRDSISRINRGVSFVNNQKFIRNGTVWKFSEAKNKFEQCYLKLYHDYLTFYKEKSKEEQKVSFMPLENSAVEMESEKKCLFNVRDRFKVIRFKTASRQDMTGWLVAINQAIKIRNAQIYMNEFDQKLKQNRKDKISLFANKCQHLKEHSRLLPFDDVGRQVLKQYFKKNVQLLNWQDQNLIQIIQSYLSMCFVRREAGEKQSQQLLNSLKANLQALYNNLEKEAETIEEKNQNTNEQIENSDQTPRNTNLKKSQLQRKESSKTLTESFSSEFLVRKGSNYCPKLKLSKKDDISKSIEEIMKYLDLKYYSKVMDKKHFYPCFTTFMVTEYRQRQIIPMRSLLGISRIN